MNYSIKIIFITFFICNLNTKNNNKQYIDNSIEHVIYDKPCQQCTNSLQDARKQILDLEKRLHAIQEDLRKWMKAYSDEVASKSSFYQKILGDLTDMYNKYVSTEIKLSTKK